MSKLFKIANFEEELAAEMEKNLISNQAEARFNLKEISKAADHINSAAELLDSAGFVVEAETLTRVLEALAHGDDLREIIIEPLEQEIVREPHKPGSLPLEVSEDGKIFESPEVLEFKSLAKKKL